MLPLESNVEDKEIKLLKIITANKLLTRLPVLLEQIKTGKSNKLKNEIRQMPYVLRQHNKITRQLYSNLIKLL